MKTGDVFYWETGRAIGHEVRKKYHVYICDGDWRHQGKIFLFINKSNAHQGYLITNPPYNFLTLQESYISCTGIVAYSDSEMGLLSRTRVGSILKAHLLELRNVIAGSDVMEKHAINLVCNALDALRK